MLESSPTRVETNLAFGTSSAREETSSSPFTDGAGDALMDGAGDSLMDGAGDSLIDGAGDSPMDGAGDASVKVDLVSAIEGDEYPSSTAFCRLQYIMLAVKVRIILLFTC